MMNYFYEFITCWTLNAQMCFRKKKSAHDQSILMFVSTMLLKLGKNSITVGSTIKIIKCPKSPQYKTST